MPACTGTGLAEFVIESAAEVPTWTMAVALLLLGFWSAVALLTETLSVMVVPEVTVTTKVTVLVFPDAIVPEVQL